MGRILNIFAKNISGKKRFQNFWTELYQVSLIGMNIGGGGDFETSGEKSALEYVKTRVMRKRNPIVFDVGANIGGYTQKLIKCIPNAKIHSFEPAQATFKTLSQNIKADNVTLNNFGISDACSESILFYEKENSVLASLYNRQLDYFGLDLSKSETVKLDTIDNYCNNKKICNCSAPR